MIRHSYILDISGRVEKYDLALYESISQEKQGHGVRMLMPGMGLLSLVPRRYKTSMSVLKRTLKGLEIGINYLYVCMLMTFSKVQLIHLQWLPLLEVNGVEIYFLKLLKCVSPSLKIVLTIHNVYPHDMNEQGKTSFRTRFISVCSYIDEFIVHTRISKSEVEREFCLSPDRINVCCHGVFVPEGVVPKTTNRAGGKLHILQFGGQSFYKGTDILVDAVCGLDKTYQEKLDVHIVGGISDGLYSELKGKDKDGIITWKPYFLDDNELYEEINNSDIIVLPYRAISQSGVLLLSIFFGKLIICSDLPSFKETMQGGEGNGLDDALFFASESHYSLRNLITKYINKEIDETAVHERIERLKDLYSWESAAKATLEVYNK